MEMGEDDLQKTWKKYFEDLYNFDTKEGVKLNMCVIFMRLEDIIILGRVSNQKWGGRENKKAQNW